MDRHSHPGHGPAASWRPVNCRYILPDPIDPELIASKLKEALSSKTKEQRLQKDGLEFDLKQFLKLD